MRRARYIACAVLLLCPLALSRHDDDFAFDNSEEFQVSNPEYHNPGRPAPHSDTKITNTNLVASVRQ